MKKLLAVALSLAFALRLSAQVPAIPKDVKWDLKPYATSYQFGDISLSRPKRTVVFVMTNVSDTPIYVKAVNTTCSCTKAQFSKKPIAPGEKGYITVSFTANKNLLGHFRKHVSVHTSGSPRIFRLYIEGNVKE